MTAQTPKTASVDDIEDLDSVLSGLDTTVNNEELIEEVDQILANGEGPTIEEGLDDLDLEADEKEIMRSSARAERHSAYEKQESTVDADTAPKKKKKEAAPKAEKPAKKAKEEGSETSSPKIVRDLASLPAEIFVLDTLSPPLSPEALEKAKADTMAAMPDQKKVKEKFENLFVSLHAGRMPSTFITQAFILLDETGSTSSTDIVAAFKTKGAKNKDEGYNEGTARSQAGQIMSLFEAVKIASRHKQALQLNKDSAVAARLRKIIEDNSKPAA